MADKKQGGKKLNRIPQQYVQYIHDPINIGGILYALIPSLYGDKTKGIGNAITGLDTKSNDVFVKNDNGTWVYTRMDQDGSNIHLWYNNKKIMNLSNQIIDSQQKQSPEYHTAMMHKVDNFVRSRLYPYSGFNLYNWIVNGAKYAGHYFFDKNSDALIDLNDENVIKIDPKLSHNNVKDILANDFVEPNSGPQYARDIRTGKAKWFGKDLNTGEAIPYSNISNYYSVKDGKLIAGPLEIFDDLDIVVPNRVSKNIGKIKEIIYPKLDENLRLIKPVAVINELNDTIYDPNLNMGTKILFSNENGNGIFMSYDMYNEDQLKAINEKLKESPRYPIMIDNGRYGHYLLNNDNVDEYVSPLDREKTMYIIGTSKAKGGLLERIKYLNKIK